MLTVKLLALEIGAILIYAGITGRSVGALLRGDNQTQAANRQIASTSTSPASAAGTASGQPVSGQTARNVAAG